MFVQSIVSDGLNADPASFQLPSDARLVGFSSTAQCVVSLDGTKTLNDWSTLFANVRDTLLISADFTTGQIFPIPLLKDSWVFVAMGNNTGNICLYFDDSVS